ncbi:MAG: ATP-binding protein [Candidatus Eisenbacteria bacterium]
MDRRLHEQELIQVLIGPRQVGKTTIARTIGDRWPGPAIYASADEPLPPGASWVHSQWERARARAGESPALLILDEVQKVQGWSESVKALWDEDRYKGTNLAVLLLGSSALLLSEGTTESLTGRFFLNRCVHWSYDECRDAFGWDLDRWIYFGGYPGSVKLIGRDDEWRQFVNDSLIETVISRDVLASHRIAKPVLLRHLFLLAARFPAQVVSYSKMLGQLQDAGNTTTLANYVRILETAFLLSGLERFSAGHARSRGSSPKLVFWNNALVSAPGLRSFEDARSDPAYWGRLVENAVGAHLLNRLQSLPYDIGYWRHRNDEVDYVVRTPNRLWAIEVKSGRPDATRGLDAFCRLHREARPMIVGTSGMPLDEFFGTDPVHWLAN